MLTVIVVLLIMSGLVEAAGIAGAALLTPESLWFDLSMRGIDAGVLGFLVCLVNYRRRSVEAAFELGVQVGERRGRRTAKPVVVRLPDGDDHDGGPRVAGRRHHRASV